MGPRYQDSIRKGGDLPRARTPLPVRHDVSRLVVRLMIYCHRNQGRRSSRASVLLTPWVSGDAFGLLSGDEFGDWPFVE
jgi:hypothetical protein